MATKLSATPRKSTRSPKAKAVDGDAAEPGVFELEADAFTFVATAEGLKETKPKAAGKKRSAGSSGIQSRSSEHADGDMVFDPSLPVLTVANDGRTQLLEMGERALSPELEQAINRAKDGKIKRDRQVAGMVVDVSGGQLPLWDERLRGLPNSLARGALFTCRGKAVERQRFINEQIASTAGTVVTYTGEELRQDDQDVWLQIAHLSRSHPLGNQVELSAYQLLKALGWANSSRDYTRLRNSFERLTAGSIKISFENGRHGFQGHLVEKVMWADAGSGKRERWRIRLDPEILEIFGPSDYSLIDWRQRMQLRTLAKWLHSFYTTHREPLGYTTKLLLTQSGSSHKHVYGFRRDLTRALDELVRVGFLAQFRLEGASDVVVVRRARPQYLAGSTTQLIEN